MARKNALTLHAPRSHARRRRNLFGCGSAALGYVRGSRGDMISQSDRRPPIIASRRFSPWLALGAVAGLALFFYAFDPRSHAFYLPCPLNRLTGLECPACGSQRAVHQLLHGNFEAAVRLNALFVTLLPVMIWYGARALLRVTSGRDLPMICNGRAWLWLLAALVVTFGVYRNLRSRLDGPDTTIVRASRAPPS